MTIAGVPDHAGERMQLELARHAVVVESSASFPRSGVSCFHAPDESL